MEENNNDNLKMCNKCKKTYEIEHFKTVYRKNNCSTCFKCRDYIRAYKEKLKLEDNKVGEKLVKITLDESLTNLEIKQKCVKCLRMQPVEKFINAKGLKFCVTCVVCRDRIKVVAAATLAAKLKA